jgi:apolipoprotein N-acyltransferase
MTRYLLAVVSGVLFALSFPDYSVGWLAFVAFLPLLVAVVRARSGWQSFFLGWLSQTTAWLMMVPWVVRVMSHYGGLPYITGVLIFIAMAIVLGLYGGLFALIGWRLRLGSGFGRWSLVPLAWAAIEYARTYLLTGFPWNLIVTAIVDYTPLVQLDRFAGPYFVGAMIMLPATVAAWVLTQRPRGFQRMLVVSALVIVMFVWWATGLVASKLIVRPTGAPAHTAALLQPNISQEMRWDEQNTLEIFQRMVEMTEQAIRGGARVVVWPESTVPLSFARTEFYRSSIEALSARFDVDIILGSVAEDDRDPGKIWNAAFLVSGGKTVGHYDKIRLVPFGEYVPLRKVLFFAEKLVRAVGEFQFGTSDRPLAGKFRYGPAICYEIVYPQITRAQVRNGAGVLVTITNDAWYDGTSAPRQHLQQARLRAIEDDRYVLRAGTTGISALINPAGEIVKELPMGREGVIFGEFQARTGWTPYVRFGDWFAWVAIAAVLVAVFRR